MNIITNLLSWEVDILYYDDKIDNMYRGIKNTIIGGNSFVNKNCEDNSVYYGAPSKKIRTRKSEDNFLRDI